MKLPFAVYTAREGYQWISGLDAGLPRLEQLRRAIGKLPEFDFGDPLSCGAINLDDMVIVYKFMKEIKGDFRGRDSLYLALTYFDKSVAGSISFEELLADTVFVSPMREPPSDLEYKSGVSAESDSDPDCLRDTDLGSAGHLFQKLSNGSLKLVQVEGAPQCTVSYTPLVVEVASAESCDVVKDELEIQPPNDSVNLKGIRRWQTIALAVVLIIVMLFGCYAVWKEFFKNDEQVWNQKETEKEVQRSLEKGSGNYE